jgi:2-methylcitrate dehydratase PrpD
MAANPTTSAPDALQALAATLEALEPETLPEAVVEAARQRVFDALCAAVLGMRTPEGEALLRMERSMRADRWPRDSIDRVRLHVAAARTTEIDDIDIASCTTVGSVVVPTALAVAATGLPGDRGLVLAGVIAGYEAMIRLGRAIGGATLLYSGIWPTYVTAAFGAAAAAAKVLRLDAASTVGALASALARTSALPRRASASFGFRYHALGAAAVEGCFAAFAADAGIVAELDDIASLERRIGAAITPADLTHGLGRDWRILEVDTKMFPSSRQALASVEAFLELELTREAIERIDSITVDVPPAYRDMVDRPNVPKQRIESMIGVQYSLALAALRPESLFDAIRASLPADQRTVELMARTHVRADPTLGEHFPRRWGSRVTVRGVSGELSSREVLEPRGSGGGRSLGWAALRRKHERIFAASGADPGVADSMAHPCELLGKAGSPHAAELLEFLQAEADARMAELP